MQIDATQKRAEITGSAGTRAAEGGKVHEIGLRDRLDGLTGLAPGGQTTHDDKRVETLLAQQMRHTGAGGFALSSAVEVDVFVFRKSFDFVGEVIGLEANRALDPRGAGVVVTVTAHINQQDLSRTG